MKDRERTRLVSFRLPESLLKRLDRYAERQTKRTGVYCTRTDALRAIVTKAVRS